MNQTVHSQHVGLWPYCGGVCGAERTSTTTATQLVPFVRPEMTGGGGVAKQGKRASCCHNNSKFMTEFLCRNSDFRI